VLIAQGRVRIVFKDKTIVLRKPSHDLNPAEILRVEIEASQQPEFVSRGGIKLHGAMRHLQLDVSGLLALDVGVSTGGFTDCLLQNGARHVVGVDVGHGQLSAKLQGHPMLTLVEGVNARDVEAASVLKMTRGEKFDLIVIDVSFISIRLVLPAVMGLLKNDGYLLGLVKPQFEVGPSKLNKQGIVTDTALFQHVQDNVVRLCQELGLNVRDYFKSSIEGTDGNQEFFIFASPEKK